VRLFHRAARVTLVPQTTDTLAPQRGNAVEIRALRIRFDVKKNLGKEPNKCVIKLSNLQPTTRALLDQKPLRVVLHAGYDGVLKLLFDGDLKRHTASREGPADVVSELHVGDGQRAYSHARMNQSYRPPVTRLRILTDCAQTMGLALPPQVLKDPQLRQPLPSGFSASSATRDVLTTLLSPLGYSWSSQNGQLVVLRDGDTLEGREFLVNQSTGLVGAPRMKESESPGKGSKTEVSFTTLLYPELVPGAVAKLESQFIRQSLKLTDCTCRGDTESAGEDFVTEIVGKPL